ncbi:MAG: hypothetical protein H6766_03080 [Candidatus Peribacteria bacterium]|nr:MAG: hypothetical protein H6766_03080 [Candidatus Peribacteria bacterium]
MKQADINPATMFISSLSAKEFFSLLSRKVTEYYKINGFDTGLETFEAKIGLGKEQGITVNKANDYYGYLIAAQYNGKGFFSPTFVSTHVTLYSATLLAPLLRDESEDVLIHTMVMIYLMPLLFVTHIKRFPSSLTPKEQYNRFVTLCLEVLCFVIEEEDEHALQTINHVLNHESSVLRNLVVICHHAEQLFPLSSDTIPSYRDRMLDPHIFDHSDEAVALFLDTYEAQSIDPTITDYEEEIMTMLFPNDFSIRSLYDQVNVFDTINSIITPWYRDDAYDIHEARSSLSDHPDQWSDILRFFSDTTYAKKRFWNSVQQFIVQHRTKQHIDINEDIDEFMSSIEEGGSIDMESVPESIRAESRVIDQIVHFYIGMVGGHR